jgi:hypothetical protein
MAGPTCSVLIPPSLNCDLAALTQELFGLTSENHDDDSFFVSDTRSIGGTYHGSARWFLWSTQLDQLEAIELDAIKAVFGWIPAAEITLAAVRNQLVDHQILAELALCLSNKLSGIIDVGGTLPIPTFTLGQAVAIPYVNSSGGLKAIWWWTRRRLKNGFNQPHSKWSSKAVV